MTEEHWELEDWFHSWPGLLLQLDTSAGTGLDAEAKVHFSV